MIFFKRILGFVLAFVFSILIEIAYYNSGFFFYGLAISLILIVFYFIRIKNRFVENKEIKSYFWACFILLLSLWCFFIVSDNFYIRNLAIIFSTYCFIVAFDSIFKKIYDNKPINSDILRNIDLLIFLFFTFFTFFIFTFIRVNLILSCFFLLFCTIVSTLIKMYWNNINFRKNKLSIFLISYIITQIYFALSLLPFNLYFLTFVLCLCYYLISDFTLEEIKGDFLMRKKLKFLIISVVFLFLTILTAILI